MVKTVSTYIKFCAKPRVRQFHIFDLVSIDSMVYSLKGFFFFFLLGEEHSLRPIFILMLNLVTFWTVKQ